MITRRDWGINKLSPRDEADYMTDLMLKEHTAEMLKCIDDPHYFFTTYCKVDISEEEFNTIMNSNNEN